MAGTMLVLIGLIVVIAFLGLGFLSHVFWIGVLVGLLLIGFQLGRAGLDPSRPAGRLNIRMLSSFGRYLEETTDRAVRKPAVVPADELPEAAGVIQSAAPEPTPPAPRATVSQAGDDDAHRQLGVAALETAVSALREELGREPDARELAAHLNVPDAVILEAVVASDVIHPAQPARGGGRHAAR